MTNNILQLRGTVSQITGQIPSISQSLESAPGLSLEKRKAILQSLATQLLAIKSSTQIVNVLIAGDGPVTVTPNQLKPQRSQDLER